MGNNYKKWGIFRDEYFDEVSKLAEKEIVKIRSKYTKDFLVMGEYNSTKMNQEINDVYKKYSIQVEREGKIKLKP